MPAPMTVAQARHHLGRATVLTVLRTVHASAIEAIGDLEVTHHRVASLDSGASRPPLCPAARWQQLLDHLGGQLLVAFSSARCELPAPGELGQTRARAVAALLLGATFELSAWPIEYDEHLESWAASDRLGDDVVTQMRQHCDTLSQSAIALLDRSELYLPHDETVSRS